MHKHTHNALTIGIHCQMRPSNPINNTTINKSNPDGTYIPQSQLDHLVSPYKCLILRTLYACLQISLKSHVLSPPITVMLILLKNMCILILERETG